jgi:hypothetical protein
MICERGKEAQVERWGMNKFSPEFSNFWLRDADRGEQPKVDGAARDEALSLAQQVALEELAERVNAARSVY